ncbi:hypothetical protein GGR56DRAFT_631506 [Xylariaceae sp. FL0804]|nr:hypothetical protein GGR56DRAFT_631506 [Xylariaceae sp. FL0804]
MALAAAYKQYLAAPNPALLADDAALHYITTTTSFRGSADVVKHLNTARNQYKKKSESFLSVVEGHNAIAAEVETAIEFTHNGGPYLPALDDNFVVDRTVTLAIAHFVTFDGNGKIVQIRQSWDQGSLLKQLDIIGKTGRNWPIRDSQDQIKLIESCIKASSSAVAAAPVAPAAQQDLPVRARATSPNATRDPHASLSLFGPRDEDEQNIAAVISPRGGTRPRQRDFSEILGDEPADSHNSPSASHVRSESPSKTIAPKRGVQPRQRDFSEILGDEGMDDLGAGEGNRQSVISPRGGVRHQQRNFADIFGDEHPDAPDSPSAARGRPGSPNKAVAPKAGAGKNFQPSRLFGDDETDQSGSTNDRAYRPHPKKYQHFDFADGSEPQDAPKKGESTPEKTKHSSQWSFDDFTTPAAAKKQEMKATRQQKVRHWGPEDDEPLDSPVRKPAPPKPRRDAETHFDFIDDGPEAESHPARPRGAMQNSGLGLYQNNMMLDEDENGEATTGGQGPLGTITNTNLKDRGRDFGAHWDMTDEPSNGKSPARGPVGDGRQKAVRMMDANWAAYDESPRQKENKLAGAKNGSGTGENRGIAIAGDGMGGNKGSNRNWFFGEGDESQDTNTVPGRKPAPAKSGGFNWDF